MKAKYKRWLKNKYLIAITIVVVLIIVAVVVRRSRAAAPFESAEVARGSVVQTVGVTGTASPVGKADLAFEKSGSLARLYVKVGDKVFAGQVLGSLDAGSDAANLAAAQANFSDTARALRPEELQVEQFKVKAAEVTLANTQKDALDAARSGYTTIYGALVNNTDSFFRNPQSANPTITLPTDSYAIESRINSERLLVSGALRDWSEDLASGSTTLSRIHAHVSIVKIFMDDLSGIVNRLTPGNSGLSVSETSAALATMNAGLAGLNTAINTITTAETALNTAIANAGQVQSSYSLKVAGNSSDVVSGYAAKVDAAAAELAKDSVRSPLNGVVTKVVPELGEFVSAGQTAFGVIGDGSYKIEAFVPESDIAKIHVGNLASTTLDAYGADVDFPATVTIIDPAETVLEGVPTYKVTLQFVTADERIRSGMTANLDINTNRKDEVLVIPSRAVLDEEGKKTVRLVNPDGKTYTAVPVTTGLKGSDGLIEIVSGLKVGDKVVTYVKS